MLATVRKTISTRVCTNIRGLSDYICVSEDNGIRLITMKHEKTRNALGKEMMKDLIAAINKNKDDVNLRTIVLAAKGKVFSAGHNLKEFHCSSGGEAHKLIFCLATDLMLAINESPVPVIAKVNGLAAAAGCQLAAACDMVVCSDRSTFSTPGANFGIFCSTPGVALSRTVHKSTALYMLLTGDEINAKQAFAAGLVTKVVPEDQLDRAVCEINSRIQAKSRAVVTLGKRFYYQQVNLPLKNAYVSGGETMLANISMCDGQEGINSFIEKRKAQWKHSEPSN